MTDIESDGFHGDPMDNRGAFIYCSDPAHVVAKLVEAGVLEEAKALTYHDDGSVGPLYRINLPTEGDDE